jgi:WD40 repeat protein
MRTTHRRAARWAGLLLGIVSAAATRAETPPSPLRTFGLGGLERISVAPDARTFATAGPTGVFLWDLAGNLPVRPIKNPAWRVSAIAFSPDNRLLLTAGADGVIQAWDPTSATLLRTFAGHRGEILHLAFGPEGRSFVSSGFDNTARLWSLDSGEPGPAITIPGTLVRAAAFTPDGRRLVTADGSPTNNVRLWDLGTGTTLRTFGEHVGQVTCLGFVAGGLLATAGDDRLVRFWDPDTATLVRTLPGATGSITTLISQPADSSVMIGCSDGRVLIWNVATGERLAESTGEPFHQLDLIPGTGRILVAHTDQRIRERDPATGTVSRTLAGHTAPVVTGVAFSPDGTRLLSGGLEADIRVWDRTTGDEVRSLAGHGGGTANVEFSPDGRRILSTRGAPRPAAQLWDAQSGRLEREFTWDTGWPTWATFSPDGTRIATAAQNPTILVWDVASGTRVRALTGQQGIVTTVAFSPDGTRLAGGGSSFTPVVHLWDLPSGRILHTFELEAGSVASLDFSSDGTDLLVGWQDGALRVFDVESGKMKREYQVATGFLNAAVYSPDDSLILTGEGWPSFVARLLEADSGRTLRLFADHRWEVKTVAFDTTATRILTGSDTVRLWNVSDLAARLRFARTANGLELRWDQGTLQQAASPDGPWQDLPDATSPWLVPPSAPRAFHRVRTPVGID